VKLAAVALVLLLAGCATPAPFEPDVATTPHRPTPIGPPLRFGGIVKDAVTLEPVAHAAVRLDLAQTLPCGRQGVGWTSWQPPQANGTFGPLEVARPRSDDVAFFLHARADGYAPNATFIGPAQARGDLGNMTVLLHPDAAIEGRAPPGTLLALDAPPFPRVALADANGTFRFPQARAADATLVAATDVPFVTTVRPPAQVEVERDAARGWTLEGVVKGPTGAPVAADVVAWNGTRLESVARSGASGAFAMPLPPRPAELRIEARTADNSYGGVLTLDLKGPPALRETVLVKPLC